MIAGGVLRFLEEAQVKQFFSMLADNFPGGEIVFNAMSRSDGGFGTWSDRFPPEQQDAMRATLVEALKDWWEKALKDWWEKAPQDQKGKLNDMIAMLKTPTKPKGKEWTDIEAWWNQLSDTEKEGAVRNLMTSSFRGGASMWMKGDVNGSTKWDSRITVIDQFPMFKNIPRDSLSTDMRKLMDHSDESRGSSIFHLRV
jgi:hypothetical protein